MLYEGLHDITRERYFEELKTEPAALREALIFRKTLEDTPIHIREGDCIAGWVGYEESSGITKPENSRGFEVRDTYTPEERHINEALNRRFLIEPCYTPGHTCIGYKDILEKGLRAYAAAVEKELEKPETGEEKAVMLKAMLMSLEAVSVYAKRFSDLALDLAGKAGTEEDKNRLLRIHRALAKVPIEGADDFFEALQSVWILRTVTGISEKCWASISLGRFDQYLYPYYKKSMEKGETREEAATWLKQFFLLLDSYGDPACALNIGGTDGGGRDQMNDLSRLLIEVEKEMRLRSPILAARIGENTPDSILDELVAPELFQIGQPTFYGEESCRKAMSYRGVSPEEAVDFSVNSCMGLAVAGKEIANMWGCKFNMHLPLELAVGNGRPLFGEIPFPLKTKAGKGPRNLEELFGLYREYARELLGRAAELSRKAALYYAVNSPNPFLSAITEGCLERGLDRSIGAVYETTTVETMALINTGNAFNAINTLVFTEKRYTLDDFIKAAESNYAGHEDMLAAIKSCEKYGTADAGADACCVRLAEILAELCGELKTGNILYLPSLHTLDANVGYGSRLYATFDGRLKGEPVNKNAGPTNDVRKNEPTSMILSAASLPQYTFSGGQPIDLSFDKNSLSNAEGCKKIAALIRVYFKSGGMQLQVNSIDPETLEKAYRNPDQYRNLIVRIGGYSMRFCDMHRDAQAEFIERIRRESGVA
jgi:formate C-acetyltransferase